MSGARTRSHRAQAVLLAPPLLLLAWWAATARPLLYPIYHALSVFAAEQLGGLPARLLPQALPPGWRPPADSWDPMVHAHAALLAGSSPYAVFFRDGIRFQYPPLSLLLVVPFAAAGQRGFAVAMNALTVLAHGGVALLAGLVARDAWRRRAGAGAGGGAAAFGIAAVGAATFPPLLFGTGEGQVQTLLTLAVLLAVVLFQRCAEASACAIVAASCVFKPMLAPIALWALLAGFRRAAVAFAAVGAALAALSVLLFGIEAHLDYLRVLSHLGAASERLIGNSAPAGLVSRAVLAPAEWGTLGFNDPDPAVRATGLATQVALMLVGLGTGLVARHDATLAFATALAALSIASPVIWPHHYTFVLPLAILSLVTLLSRAGERRAGSQALAWTLGMALITLVPRPFRMLRLEPALAQVVSVLPFLGALCLVGLGWWLLAQARREAAGARALAAA